MWYDDAVFYQIYIRSFSDSDGDGVGDIRGIIDKLSYIKHLGVDCLWLSPVYPSPNADFGYDVSNYEAVAPEFGGMKAFDDLLTAVHMAGMRLILDWVPNHTSIEHPWFVESRSSLDNPKRDWYFWRPASPQGGPPNSWHTSFSPDISAWTLDDTTGEYYFHLFDKGQPDLNWRNPDVHDAMLNSLRFWLDKGVDGFRIDVAYHLFKDPDLVEDPLINVHGKAREQAIHHLWHEVRELLDSYPHNPMAVGEVGLHTLPEIAAYYGGENSSELQLAFDFPAMLGPFANDEWINNLRQAKELLLDKGLRPAWVLENHDRRRFPDRVDAAEDLIRAALLFLATLPGAVFLYQGEELGLNNGPATNTADPYGRDGERAPIPWKQGVSHGWEHPWLPLPKNSLTHNVEKEQQDTNSPLNLTTAALRLRRSIITLPYRQLDEALPSYAWGHFAILVNLSKHEVKVPHLQGATVVLSSSSLSEFVGTVPPETTVILDTDTVVVSQQPELVDTQLEPMLKTESSHRTAATVIVTALIAGISVYAIVNGSAWGGVLGLSTALVVVLSLQLHFLAQTDQDDI